MGLRAIGLACIISFGNFGCAPSHQTGGDDSRAVLTVSPATSELLIVNTTFPTEDFTATATYPDGTVRDVTADVHFTIDTSYGDFTDTTLTMRSAGKTSVFAAWTDKVASAQVIARFKGVRVDPNVPPNAPDWFAGPEDPTHAPNVLYPPVGVIMPRNLGDFEAHWTDASSNDVFEISLTTEFTDVRAYVLGGNGPYPAVGPDPTWASFLSTEWSTVVGNEAAVTLQVRGVQSSNPVSVGSAPPQLIKLSNEQMLGGIYYWAAAGSTSPEGIFRHDMSKPGQPAEEFMTKNQTSNRCVACHVLSRDGTEMAITWDGGNAMANMVDVATRKVQAIPDKFAWNFGTFTPDGSQFLSVHGGVLVVRNYADQSILKTATSAGWVTHPDLSPDGTVLAYVRPTTAGADWTFTGGQIYTRTYDATSLSFGPETPLVVDPASTNYYPSFSPDGKWILFNRAPNGDAYNNPNASLWVVKADGSAPAIQLAKANIALDLGNSWGRWAPFAQTIGANSEQMFWVTVSSKREFGVRLHQIEIPPSSGPLPGRPQIWMSPFFPDRAETGTDPSEVAFRLPFQNIDSNNHIAQWTEQVIATQ